MNQLEQFQKLLYKKSGLLKCIFSTLLFQVLITTMVVFYLYNNSSSFDSFLNGVPIMFFILFLFAISIFLIVNVLSANMSFQTRISLFVLFSIVEGVFLAIVTRYIPRDIISSALVSTIAIFFSFLFFGFLVVYFGIDLSWMTMFLFFSLLGVILYRIVLMFMPDSRYQRIYLVTFVLFLFSLFILYDTNNILLKYRDDGRDCVRGALDYYLDIINIFVHSLNTN